MKYNFDIIPVPVSVRKSDGRYQYVNRAWMDMFSLDGAATIGHTDQELSLDPLALPEGEPGTQAGEYVYRDVYITTREKGRLLLELIETRLGGDDGEGVICVHQDMTGIGWRMEDLTRNLSRCEYRARQNAQHVVRMSRDMCEPLEQMMHHCDKLMQGSLEGEQRDTIALVRDNARLLQKQIQRGLDLTILDESCENGGEEALLIGPILESCEALYAGISRDKGVLIRTHLDTALEKPVLADAQKLRQIVVNLLDSAVRMSRSGQVKLSATIIPDSDRPLCLKVCVENPREDGNATDAHSITTSGMGLSHKILRGLCGLLGGRLEINRESDGARTMKVYLRANRPGKARGRH